MGEIKNGRVLSCVGGLYSVYDGNETYLCYAKGKFRHDGISPVSGDFIRFTVNEGSQKAERESGNAKRKEDGYILEIEDRRNLLPRPPIANIDTLFIVCAAANPDPDTLAIDKLTVIAECKGIEPILIFNKADLNPDNAKRMNSIYTSAGFKVLTMAALSDDDIKSEIYPLLKGKTSAFAGPSGVGKSTIMNALFPLLNRTTGSISERTKRGRHTTRESTLYDLKLLSDEFADGNSFLADTPGFSALEFDKFAYLEKSELPYSYRDFEDYIGKCRYTKCTHLCEDGCAIIEALSKKKIELSRHESYKALYSDLSKIKKYKH